MVPFEILRNPRCSKSRATLQRLRDAGVEPVVIEYLQHPPTRERLAEILALLGLEDPRALMRKGEAIYAELGLGQVSDRDRLLDAMVEHPILIERPILVRGRRAVVGRPLERILELL